MKPNIEALPFDPDPPRRFLGLDELLEEVDAALDALFLGDVRAALERGASPAADRSPRRQPEPLPRPRRSALSAAARSAGTPPPRRRAPPPTSAGAEMMWAIRMWRENRNERPSAV